MELKSELFKHAITHANRVNRNAMGVTDFFLNFKALVNSINFEVINDKPENINIYYKFDLQTEINKVDQAIELCNLALELSDEICENAIDLNIAVNSL